MSRQQVEFKVVGTDKDSGEEDVTAIKPVADGEPGQAAVFKRPSENLRTRTEVIRDELENLKYLSDADRAFLLTSTGSITWNGLPTGTFSTSADMTLKPFLAPNASTAARLIIAAGTVGQVTIRTRQNGVSGQPRAYNGANAISIDFTPVTLGTGAIVVTSDGTPNNNVHVQYDDHAVSGTTVDQIPANSFVQQFNASAVAITLGLEAVVEGTGSPVEVGFPTPPASVAATKLADPVNGIQPAEQLTRFMSGAADAEKHNITQAHLTTFFSDPMNVLLEGDVLCLRYDDLVLISDGGRRQSIDEFPENKADVAGLNLFIMRRFPDRLPGALPIAAVVNGVLIFVNGRSFASGEVGPLVAAGASYQGSPAAPNSWADGTTVAGPISFETALDTIIQTLGTKAGGSPGAIKIGFTPSGNIASNTVKGALEELDSEKAGLALANTFTSTNTFTPGAAGTAITATGNGTGSGGSFIGGVTNGLGIVAQGTGTGQGIQATGGILGVGVSGFGGATSGTGVEGWGTAAGEVGVWGHGAGAGYGVRGTGGSGGGVGVHGLGQANGAGVTGLGNGTGAGGSFVGGNDGTGVTGLGFGTGNGGTFTSDTTSAAGTAALKGLSLSTAGSIGVWGVATGTYPGVKAQAASSGPGVEAQGGPTGIGVDIVGRDRWDLTNTEGDFRVGNVTNKFRIGVALGGGGAGTVNMASTSTLTLGTGTTAGDLGALKVIGGKVGIGNVSPSTDTLEVSGTAKTTSDAKIGGDVIQSSGAGRFKYGTTRGGAMYLSGSDFQYRSVSGTFAYAGPQSVENRIGVAAINSSTEIWAAFRLPLGAVITSVSYIMTHGGGGAGGASLSVSMRRYAIGSLSPAPAYDIAQVLTGGGSVGVTLTAGAQLAEPLGVSLTATAADRTVNTEYQFFSTWASLATGASVAYNYLDMIVIAYDYTNVHSFNLIR